MFDAGPTILYALPYSNGPLMVMVVVVVVGGCINYVKAEVL